MIRVADAIPGYTYGAADLPTSPVSLDDLRQLRLTAGLTADDERWLREAGAALADQTAILVDHWRGRIIAALPHLARHSRGVDGGPLPASLAASSLRFRQWVVDTCLRPYDQGWLDHQHEIARRHTRSLKNRTDGVRSTPFVPFHDVVEFVAVMNETIRPYLAAGGRDPAEVSALHAAWCRSLQLQLALWVRSYAAAAATDGGQW